MFKNFNFSSYFYSPETFANKLLEVYFSGEKPSYPINPFKILDELSVVYQFRDLGFYLSVGKTKAWSLFQINK